jgi:cation diffusion facilitator family transporter
MSQRADLNLRRRYAVSLCIGTTVIVACTELTAGRWFNLISITAEGLHTAADLADSVIAMVLVVVAGRPATGKHPFGHGKYDSLASVIEGLFVAASGCWAIFESGRVLLGLAEGHPRPEAPVIVAMGAASILYLVVSAAVLRIARETQSPAVRAEALHLRSHVYITIGLLASLVLTRFGEWLRWPHADHIDAVAAIVLGAYLLLLAYQIGWPGLRQLLDSALPSEEIEELASCLAEFRDEFVEIHNVRTRRAGTDRHVDIHLVVPGAMPVEQAHRLSHRIEARLVDRYPGTRLLVHVEPASPPALRAYIERDHVGVVVIAQSGIVSGEASHHEPYQHAHEI